MLIFLFLFVNIVCAVNVLIYNPSYGQSHVNFMGNIADVLHRAGHNVTQLAPVFDPELKPYGSKENVHKILFTSKYLEVERWGEMPAKSGSIWETEINRGESFDFKDFENFEFIQRSICKGILEETELVNSLRAVKFDIGITETFDYSGIAVFELLNIPRFVAAASLGQIDVHNEVTGIPQFTSFTPNWLTGYTHEMSLLERFISLKVMLKGWYYNNKFEKNLQELFNSYHPGFPNLKKIMMSKTGIVLNNVNEFTETPRLRTNMIQYIGGANHYVKPLSEESEALLSKRERTVFFSFGSFVSICDMPLRYKKAFADAFSSFPDVTFVWKYEKCGNNTFEKTGYQNIEFTEWAPQNELLNDDRLVLFITHAGMNSVHESTHSGTPMLAIPVFADQLVNAENIARSGVAINLDRTAITRDKLVELIGKMIKTDSIYHERALHMKKILAGRPDRYRQKIVEWIERLSDPLGPTLTLSLQTREIMFGFCLLLTLVLPVFAQWGGSPMGSESGYPMGQQMGQMGQPMGQMGYPQDNSQYGQYIQQPYQQQQDIYSRGIGNIGGMMSGYPNTRLGSAPIYRPQSIGIPLPFDGQMASMMGQNGQMGQLSMGSGSMGQMYPMGGMGLSPMATMGRRMMGDFQTDPSQNTVNKEVPASGPTRVIPPFLQGASVQELNQFYAIVQHPTWSPEEKQRKIDEFVRTLKIDAQNIYAEFQRSTLSATSSKRQKIHQIVNEMTNDAQIHFQKVSAVLSNPNISEEERLKKVEEMYAKIPDAVKKEFDAKLTGF